MSSTNRKLAKERHKSDYYITPIDQIILFLQEFKLIEPNLLIKKILDPCAGGNLKCQMSYPEALKSFGISHKNITTNDIREDSKAQFKFDYLNHEFKGFDIIITNPPFNLAENIIPKALEEVNHNGWVIMLLRLNYFGSKKRKNFFEQYMPMYSFVHHQRMSFKDNGNTDSIEYAHFVWKKNYYPEFTLLKVI